MATAVKTVPAPAKTAQENSRSLVRVSRRCKKRRSAIFSRVVLCTLTITFLLGYIGLYAKVTHDGYHAYDLRKQIRQARMESQILKADIASLASAARLAKVATKAGMNKGEDSVVFISSSENIKVAKAN